MPLALIINNSDSTYALWKIEEKEEDLLPLLQLNDLEFMQFNAFINSKRKMHWLASRVLLRKLLNTDQFIELNFDEHKKPILGNFGFNISISHSGDYAAVMLSNSRPVGIDIELISPKIDRVKHKFLSAEEMNLLGEENLIEKLYACWSAKESVYKWFGQPGVDFIKNLPIRKIDFEKGLIYIDFNKNNINKLLEVNFFKVDGYMLSIVV